MNCPSSTFNLFKILAAKPLRELDLDDLMLLTGHDSCCGEKLRAEQKALSEAGA